VFQLATNESVGIASLPLSFSSELWQEHAPERGTINPFHAAKLGIESAKCAAEASSRNIISPVARHSVVVGPGTASDERAVADN